jgi:hypothetical protein
LGDTGGPIGGSINGGMVADFDTLFSGGAVSGADRSPPGKRPSGAGAVENSVNSGRSGNAYPSMRLIVSRRLVVTDSKTYSAFTTQWQPVSAAS